MRKRSPKRHVFPRRTIEGTRFTRKPKDTLSHDAALDYGSPSLNRIGPRPQ